MQTPAFSNTRSSKPSRVLLVGAGHAHVEVLARWAADPPRNASLTLVVDHGHATYSGMVPGVVAGDYRPGDARMAIAPLAGKAAAELVIGRVDGIDAASQSVHLEDGTTLEYDVASLNVGSTVRGLKMPGVREHALATRPIGEFLARLDEELSGRLRALTAPRVVVVGAGAAGIELAFTLDARLAADGLPSDIVVACGSAGLLPGYAPRPRHLVATEAASRGITIAATSDVLFADANGVGFASGHLRADLVVWATGAASPECITASPLPHDLHGFVRVMPTLQVRGHRSLFAVGDCAAIDGQASLPKAGVHAVRAGPVLDANLRASLAGHALRSFEPQRDFLSLLNLGGRRALATKWGLAWAGRLPWIVKDRIDRRYVDRFR